MQSLIKIAAGEIGVKEIPGEKNEKRIIDYAKEAGFNNITDDETPWCSIFVNWCCMKAGLQRSNRTNARSWLTVGIPTDKPEPGDIIVFWRDKPSSWKGHVGIFLGFSKNKDLVFTLGGNQRNTVSIQGYDTSKVLGYRRLTSQNMPKIPKSNPNLKRGSRNDQVTLLQTILHELGYNCGSIDGVFGKKTEAKLIEFQKDGGKKETGIYDAETKSLLESILQS